MIRSICNTLVVLSVCAALYVAVQPAFAQTSTAGSTASSNASEWTPAAVTALLVAIGGIITGIGLDHGVGHPSDSCPRWKHLTH
jgi:hypothetical protein